MDGWNEDKLEGVIGVLDDIYNLSYELRNSVRGRCTGVYTYKELQDYIIELADRLHTEAEWMDTEEEEGYEDLKPNQLAELRRKLQGTESTT